MTRTSLVTVALFTFGFMVMAQDMGDSPTAISLTPDEMKWVDGPSSLPAGVKIAVIEGNMKNPGLFTMRLKVPAGTALLPHKHPADEHLTIISGKLWVGHGAKFEPAKAKELPAGGFAVAPVKAPMFAYTKDQEAVFQVHAMGPWGIEYVNPADDPRNQKKK